MEPKEFKRRFQTAQGEVPEDLDLDFGKFRTFDPVSIANLDISESDKRILREVGFPEDAAPFLSFDQKDDVALKPPSSIDPNLGDEFNCYKVLGINGSGDFVCIEDGTGNIVYLNHDWDMKRIFINSSLGKFSECLCLMAEAMESNYQIDFLGSVKKIDPPAILEESMWPAEYEMMKE